MSLPCPIPIRRAARSAVLAGLLAAVVAGCGTADAPDRATAAPAPATAPPPPGSAPLPSAPGARETAPASTDPSPAQPPAPQAVAPRIGARGAPDVEACIERRIHDPAYDGLNPRDPRRRLRRLEVKAACEEQVASR